MLHGDEFRSLLDIIHEDRNRLLSADDSLRYLAAAGVVVSMKTLMRWIMGGRIRARRLGRKWYITLAELTRVLSEGTDAV